MPTTSPTSPVTDLDNLYNIAVWMYETREAARVVTMAVMEAHPGLELEGLLSHVCRPLLGQPPRGPQAKRGVHQLRVLDDVLRSAATIPVGTDHPLVRGEPRRLLILQSQLKRTCLWSVLRALPPMPRAAFVLESILGYSLAQIAAVCGTTIVNAGHSRQRALRRLNDYLAVRCEHIDPRNMCRCRARLGVALAQGFLNGQQDHEHELEHDTEPAPVRASGGPAPIYAALPLFRLEGGSTAGGR